MYSIKDALGERYSYAEMANLVRLTGPTLGCHELLDYGAIGSCEQHESK